MLNIHFDQDTMVYSLRLKIPTMGDGCVQVTN